MPPTTAHKPDRIVTHKKSLCYFTVTYSTSVYCFLVYSNHQSAFLHGGRDGAIVSAIWPKLASELHHQRNFCKISQNRATESRRALC